MMRQALAATRRACGRAMARLRGGARDEAGAATVEFVIVVPVLLMIVFSIYEAGWYMVRTTMLDRGLDLAIRDLRLGLVTDPTPATIKKRICEHAQIIKDCESSLILELTPFTLSSGAPTTEPVCVDRSAGVINPPVTYTPGAPSQIMFVRACTVVGALFPLMGFAEAMARSANGEFAIIAHSAFVNEPQ
ncbi:TadE-like protein [Oceanicella actignis]|nr:TadE-like protein [Oceanicella actignis]